MTHATSAKQAHFERPRIMFVPFLRSTLRARERRIAGCCRSRPDVRKPLRRNEISKKPARNTPITRPIGARSVERPGLTQLLSAGVPLPTRARRLIHRACRTSRNRWSSESSCWPPAARARLRIRRSPRRRLLRARPAAREQRSRPSNARREAATSSATSATGLLSARTTSARAARHRAPTSSRRRVGRSASRAPSAARSDGRPRLGTPRGRSPLRGERHVACIRLA